nr:hypothetical protein [Tanacetum cinerariifolium]
MDSMDKDAQAAEILSLKERVNKLEKRHIIYKYIYKLSGLYPFRSSFSKKRRLGKEHVSKQGRKKAKTGPNIKEGDFNKLDDLVDEGVDYAMNEGRSTNKIKVLNTKAEGVSAAGETLSAATLAVSAATLAVGTASVQEANISTVGIMVEPAPTKELKKKDFDTAQIARDEEIARQLEVQSKMDASKELTARLQMEEREMYTVEERLRLLAEFFENRKKQLEAKRSAAIKNMPPTKIQLRSLMMTYLKNMDFVPIGSEEDEKRIRDMNKKAEGESSDKVLDKRYPIVDWKSEFYHNDRYGELYDYYRVFRANGSSRYIKTFTEMVSKFDRKKEAKMGMRKFFKCWFHHHTTNGHQFTMSNRYKELAIPEQMASELACPKQMALGKDFSNPLMADSLPKTIWLSIHHVIAMKNWLFQGKWQPIVQIFLWIIDSGCLKHMMSNCALLTNFVEKFLATVCFANNDFAMIAGY